MLLLIRLWLPDWAFCGVNRGSPHQPGYPRVWDISQPRVSTSCVFPIQRSVFQSHWCRICQHDATAILCFFLDRWLLPSPSGTTTTIHQSIFPSRSSPDSISGLSAGLGRQGRRANIGSLLTTKCNGSNQACTPSSTSSVEAIYLEVCHGRGDETSGTTTTLYIRCREQD